MQAFVWTDDGVGLLFHKLHSTLNLTKKVHLLSHFSGVGFSFAVGQSSAPSPENDVVQMRPQCFSRGDMTGLILELTLSEQTTMMRNKTFPHCVHKDLTTGKDWIYSLVFCVERISQVMVSCELHTMICSRCEISWKEFKLRIIKSWVLRDTQLRRLMRVKNEWLIKTPNNQRDRRETWNYNPTVNTCNWDISAQVGFGLYQDETGWAAARAGKVNKAISK